MVVVSCCTPCVDDEPRASYKFANQEKRLERETFMPRAVVAVVECVRVVAMPMIR